MPKYTTLNLSQILIDVLVDVLFFFNFVHRVSVFCAFVRFFKVCQTYMYMCNL